MKIYSAEESLNALRNGRASRWCGESEDEPGANESYAARRISLDYPELEVTNVFDIPRSAKIFAMGSCFAREIEVALDAAGFVVASFDKELMSSATFDGPNGSGGESFLFRYTPPSMHLEISRLLGEFDLPHDKLLVGSSDSLLDLHYGGMCHRGNIDVIAERRNKIKAVGSGLRNADVVVLTLGLTEAWFDNNSGFYINSAPDLPLLRRSQRFEMHSLSFEDCHKYISETIALIKKHNPTVNIVVTVSPVPLQATFTGQDIVIANMRSKSTLRAVAASIVETDNSILYFPSYEMVNYTARTRAWKGDLRHVARSMVEHIIGKFKAVHGISSDALNDIRLSDAWSTAKLRNTDTDSAQVFADELLLHPNAPGQGRAEVLFPDVLASGTWTFKSTLQVGHESAAPVTFGIDVLTADERVICVAEESARHGTNSQLTVPITVPAGEAASVRVWTRMSDPRSANAYAWSKFLSPKFEPAGH